MVRLRSHRKRALGRVGWELGPGLTIGVSLYSMLAKAGKSQVGLVLGWEG